MSGYIEFKDDEITKEVLDRVMVGDFIKINDWKKPMKCVAVSENYFMMLQNYFGQSQYSVCEKKKSNHSYNNFKKGTFRCGPCNYVFGPSYSIVKEPDRFLKEFESGNTELTEHSGTISISYIAIKHGI